MSKPISMFDRLRSLFGASKKSVKPAVTPTTAEKTIQAASQPDMAPAEPPVLEQTKRHFKKSTKLEKPHPLTPPLNRQRPLRPPAPPVDLTLGIDLGTSCTKVVIGDHGLLGNSYAVPVGIGTNGLDRFLRVTQVKAGRKVEANLKMRLMKDPDSESLRSLTALYLAGVIRDSLKWFFTEKAGRYKGRTLEWHLNLGFAAKQVNDGPLSKAYMEIADLAAELGPTDAPLTLASIKKLRNIPNSDSKQRVIPTSRIALYPEIAAQLASYINSPFRVQGNLILIDVGAGTLDISTAILHGNQNEDIVSFHVCGVEPLGAMKLLEARLSAIEQVSPGSVKSRLEDYQSGTVPVPESLADILSPRNLTQTCINAFNESSNDFAEKSIWAAISCAVKFRKLQLDAHASQSFDPWPHHLNFFFTGGGSRVDFYRCLFVEGRFEQLLSKYTRWKEVPEDRRRYRQGLKQEPLPLPPDLQGLPAELAPHFDRFSVAHGLAYGCENLMKITASAHS